MTKHCFSAFVIALAIATAGVIAAGTGPAKAGDIIADWNKVKAPAAPELKKVTVSPKDTALIVMDIQTNSCNKERRPRCLDTIKPVSELIKRARAKGLPVIHTMSSSGSLDKLVKNVAPQKGEPYVKGSVDKFLGTDLENILTSKHIGTVILVGTAAEGAVLGTATAAAQRKLKVIVPVDGMSSAKAYAEQYTAIYLVSSPGTSAATTLTRTGMIEIQ
jgi:nicotinamidase-related amidase